MKHTKFGFKMRCELERSFPIGYTIKPYAMPALVR